MYEMENISFQEIESGNRLQQLAVEIITFDRQAKITAVSCAIEIGERLLEAKDLVPHGEWGTWLKENVNYSQSTANNFMRLYKEYGNNQGSLFTTLTNSQTIMNLDVSKALALTVLPPEEREEFVAEHDVEQMSTRDLKEALQENRELKQQQQQLQKQLEEKDRRVRRSTRTPAMKNPFRSRSMRQRSWSRRKRLPRKKEGRASRRCSSCSGRSMPSKNRNCSLTSR